jgi:hypothetical protein
MSINKEFLLSNHKNIPITLLDDQIKKINKIISVIENIQPENSVTHQQNLNKANLISIPYNFNINNLEKANTSDFKTLSNFIDKIKMIKDSINDLKLKNTNELLEIINNKFKEYTEFRKKSVTKIINDTNIYDNIIITYLLTLLVSITISINILNEFNKGITLEDVIKNDNYLNMNNIKTVNISYVKQNNKIFFINKFYLEVIIKNNTSIIYNITNNTSNKILEQIELNIIDKKIIINNKKYEIKL